ncbi:MAG: BMC domain-containing protein [Phycisphaeraceae bacterium]|nr:BMC domain-containing protein [Phycisphaeraceae bacterium]
MTQPTGPREAIPAIGVMEISALGSAMAALDAAGKAAEFRVLQAELNDYYGFCVKITGKPADLRIALDVAAATAQKLHAPCVTRVIDAPAREAMPGILSSAETSPLIQQPLVFNPQTHETGATDMSASAPFAIGLIETQGFTAVIEAIDTACKAADVEVIGKEKLGGGYISVIVKGDVAAVNAAVAAGKEKVEGLGKLIAAHVIARPSAAVLSLLPKYECRDGVFCHPRNNLGQPRLAMNHAQNAD